MLWTSLDVIRGVRSRKLCVVRGFDIVWMGSGYDSGGENLLMSIGIFFVRIYNNFVSGTTG